MKGIFFTLSVVFAGLTVLSLLSLVSQSSLKDQDAASRVAVFNRMQDEIEYASRELIGIIKTSNITVSVNKNTASVTEDIPFPNTHGFQLNLANWKNFAESNSNFNLTLDLADLENNLLLLINGEVEYKHTNGLSGNKITIQQASSVANYSVSILIRSDGDVSFSWGTVKAGQQNFTITANSNTQTKTDSKKLDFSKGSDLDIKLKPPSGPDKVISLAIGNGADPGRLIVDDKDQLPLTLNVNVTINTTSDIHAGLSDSSININSSLYNISRTAAARIA